VARPDRVKGASSMDLRPWRGWEDLRAMQAVCSARLLAAPGRAVAHPGDIAWWAAWPVKSDETLADTFLLWEVQGELVAFAARDSEEGLAVFTAPARAETPDAIAFEEAALAWASRDGKPVQWAEFEDEYDAVSRWRDRGYDPAPGGYLNLTVSLEDVDVNAPADDRVRPVGDEDAADRASITHAAFESDRPLADYEADYAAFRASPAYPHGWDLILRDDDGRAAACCIAWIDPISRAATFEPVAAHPAFHGRGFGKALLIDGLRRFAAAGMTYAIVGVVVGNTPAEALYRSVGFRPDRTLRVYERA
jgi:ribosomal protein S18 acetylase RimI-like enzyme